MKYLSVVLLCFVPFTFSEAATCGPKETCNECIDTVGCHWCTAKRVWRGVGTPLYIGFCGPKEAKCDAHYSAFTTLFPFTNSGSEVTTSLVSYSDKDNCPKKADKTAVEATAFKDVKNCEECSNDVNYHWCQLDYFAGAGTRFVSTGGACLTTASDGSTTCDKLKKAIGATDAKKYTKGKCPAADKCDGKTCEKCASKKCVWCGQMIERVDKDSKKTVYASNLGICKPLPTVPTTDPCSGVEFGKFKDVHSYTYGGTVNTPKVMRNKFDLPKVSGPGGTCAKLEIPSTATSMKTCTDCIKDKKHKWCQLKKTDEKKKVSYGGVCVDKTICETLGQEEKKDVRLEIKAEMKDNCKSGAVRTGISTGGLVAILLGTSIYFS